MHFRRFLVFSVVLVLFGLPFIHAARVMERLGRGVVAVQQPDGKVFVSWHLFATDPANVAFNLYRTTAAVPRPDGRRFGPEPDGQPRADDTVNPNRRSFVPPPDLAAGTVKLNDTPLTGPTWFLDRDLHLDRETKYFVRAIVDGQEGEPSAPFAFSAGAPPMPYVSIPLQMPGV
jgi:rhamnogalacturonan endolyase